MHRFPKTRLLHPLHHPSSIPYCTAPAENPSALRSSLQYRACRREPLLLHAQRKYSGNELPFTCWGYASATHYPISTQRGLPPSQQSPLAENQFQPSIFTFFKKNMNIFAKMSIICKGKKTTENI